jgi:2-aminobenzoate-CoA ligase
LRQIAAKGRIDVALTEESLAGEVEAAGIIRVVSFGEADSELTHLTAGKPDRFSAVDTAQDDVCLLAFTSGTTGEPKACMHFHRDVIVMADTFCRHILKPGPDDIFTGTPPIGFTFGLGALVVFPFYARAAVALPEKATPGALAAAITRHGATICFTAPTAYRALLSLGTAGFASLRRCVSAGEPLSDVTSEAWFAATGIRIIDGIGATEMIHIFISTPQDEVRPGSTGRPIPGYVAALLDPEGKPIEGPGTGRLAIRGPTGCRYLADPRQRRYVIDGWNVTGDLYRRDADGYYWFQARSDDMILSGGYNIAGPEVERALLGHPAVAECAVIGQPDPERGEIVQAFIVLRDPAEAGPAMVRVLQDHVKQAIAPYKYPRAVTFVDTLPKTANGKIQRHALRGTAP